MFCFFASENILGGIGKMKTQKTSIAFLALLLIAITIMPIASAAENIENSINPQINDINQLINQNKMIGSEKSTSISTPSHEPIETGKDAALALTVKVTSISWAVPVGRSVTYKTQTVTDPWTPMPYMYEKSTLMKWNSGAGVWETVTSNSHPAYLWGNNIAGGTTTVQPGTYTVFGESSGNSPPLFNPPDYIHYTQSAIFTVT